MKTAGVEIPERDLKWKNQVTFPERKEQEKACSNLESLQGEEATKKDNIMNAMPGAALKHAMLKNAMLTIKLKTMIRTTRLMEKELA